MHQMAMWNFSAAAISADSARPGVAPAWMSAPSRIFSVAAKPQKKVSRRHEVRQEIDFRAVGFAHGILAQSGDHALCTGHTVADLDLNGRSQG